MSSTLSKKERDIMFKQGIDILENMSSSDKAKLRKKYPSLFEDMKDGKISTKEIVNFIAESSLPDSNKNKTTDKKTGGRIKQSGHNRLY